MSAGARTPRQELVGIASDISRCLAERRRKGLGNIFGEGALTWITAVVLNNRNLDVKAEMDSSKVFGVGQRGVINYDLVSTSNHGRTVWELKYLKVGNEQRIVKDLMRLAIRSETQPDPERLLLVSHTGPLKSNLLMAICNDGPRIFTTSFRDECVNQDLIDKLSDDACKAVRHCFERECLISFRVEQVAEEESFTEAGGISDTTRIFSVERESQTVHDFDTPSVGEQHFG